MSVRSVRIICPGATSASVAATMLVAAKAKFSAEPLGDGRWAIEAEAGEHAITLLALRIGEPLIVDVPVIEETPVAEDVAPAPAVPDNVDDVTSFRAKTLATAKTTATRTARGFGATIYGDGRWTVDGNTFCRPAYRGKQTGAIVFGAHEDGRWWCGCRCRHWRR